MIEQNIARLWQRAASASKWDAAAARAELRALGLNPHSPPPPVEVKAKPARKAPARVCDDAMAAGAAAPVTRAPARESSGTPDQVRGDEIEVRDEASSAFVTPVARQARDERPKGPAGAQEQLSAAREDSCALGSRLRGNDENREPTQLPAPVRPERHNQWTPERMSGFLRELAACQNVSQAARSVGMSRQSAYKLRDRLADKAFALAWEVALESGLQQLAHALMDRALNGEEVAVFYQGEQVGTQRKYDNRLGAWLLANPLELGRNVPARRMAAKVWEGLLGRVEREAGPR
jgi:hypothetical protein